MDDDKRVPESNQPRSERACVLELPDGPVGETDTDANSTQLELAEESQSITDTEEGQVYIDLSERNRQDPRYVQQLEGDLTVIRDMILGLMPRSDSDGDDDTDTITELCAESEELSLIPSLLRYDDDRLQRIMCLMDRYTTNLELIEHHLLNSCESLLLSRLNVMEPQFIEQGTQTTPLEQQQVELERTRGVKPNIDLGLLSCQTEEQQRLTHQLELIRCAMRNQQQRRQQQEQRQHQEQRRHQEQQRSSPGSVTPPCERRFHTITISTNSSTAFLERARPPTLLGRIGRTLKDLAGAFCLCLHINKDCVFCLGFFLAFVISASFLSAFFYRTINLTQTALRVPSNTAESSASNANVVTLNYFYMYNNQRQQLV